MNEFSVVTINSSRAPSSTRLVYELNPRANIISLNVDDLSNTRGDNEASDDIPQSINYESDQDI